jgi:hypothetical protein
MRFFQRKINLIIAAACISSFFWGCARIPQTELDAAKKAIQAAKDAEADKYMSKNFTNLENALKSAQDAIAGQQSKLPMTRTYKTVAQMLVKLEKRANEVAAEAPKVKADMTAQVKENLNLVDGMLKATAKDIKRHRRKKDKATIKELQVDLENADSAAVSAKKAFEAGDIFGARDNLNDVQAFINKITGTLKPPKEE